MGLGFINSKLQGLEGLVFGVWGFGLGFTVRGLGLGADGLMKPVGSFNEPEFRV